MNSIHKTKLFEKEIDLLKANFEELYEIDLNPDNIVTKYYDRPDWTKGIDDFPRQEIKYILKKDDLTIIYEIVKTEFGWVTSLDDNFAFLQEMIQMNNVINIQKNSEGAIVITTKSKYTKGDFSKC